LEALIAVLTVCIGLTLAVAATPAQTSEQLKGNELRRLLPGKYTLVVYGFDISVNAATNGNLTLMFLGDEMKGRWSVKDDRLCITLIQGQKSEMACSAIQYDGKKYYSAAGIKFYGSD